MPEPAGGRPLLRVVRGDPTSEELAALVAVLTTGSRPAARAKPQPRTPGGWVDRSAGLRRRLAPGPGAWRAAVRDRVAGVQTRADLS